MRILSKQLPPSLNLNFPFATASSKLQRMPITIRPATFDDWPTIVEFNCRLASETEGKELNRTHVEPGVKAVLDDERKGRYFVACEGDQIVGQLLHTFEWSDWRNGDIWWLQSVYVHPDFRRAGVFRTLFEHLRTKAAADPHVVGLRLYVETHNSGAQKTYQNLGLKDADYLVMEQILRQRI